MLTVNFYAIHVIGASEQQVEARLSAVLRSATRIEHLRIEQNPRFARLVAPDLSRAEYRQVLSRLYGFYEPLERMLAPLLEDGRVQVEFPLRRKTPLLTRDLATLGVHEEAVRRLPRCSRLPAPGTSAAALGCLYVTEGATLGGQIIARHLMRSLSVNAESGAAFFNSYRSRVGPMWRRLRQALDVLDPDATDRHAIIHAAQRTFATMDAWMRMKINFHE